MTSSDLEVQPPGRKSKMNDDLWSRAKKSFEHGDFTLLEELLGGPGGFDRNVTEWFESGAFATEPTVLAEALTCACFLGRTRLVEYLLDKGVDPTAGTATGMPAFHCAADRGNLDTVKLLIKRNAPLEQKNMYGGTVLGSTLWSAVHESRPTHAEIIEALLEAGAKVEAGTLDWWEKQDGLPVEINTRVGYALRQHGEK
jgi:ankyrin repeat protein